MLGLAYVAIKTDPRLFFVVKLGDPTKLAVLIMLAVSALFSLSMAIVLYVRGGRPQMPLLIRALYCLASFAGCIMWIDLLAEEMVGLLVAGGTQLLRAEGARLDVIGVTALAWGNSVPDAIACYILACRQRRRAETAARTGEVLTAGTNLATMSIAGCFGASVFNLTIAVGVPLLAVAAGRVEAPDLSLSVLLFVCFVTQWWVLVALSHAVVSGNYAISKCFALFLCGVYVGFLVVGGLAVGLDWKFPGVATPPTTG